MPELVIDFATVCSECGDDLESSVSSDRWGQAVEAEPCKRCLSDSYDTGLDEGYEKGWKEGVKLGHTDGYAEGYEEGHEAGYRDCLDDINGGKNETSE